MDNVLAILFLLSIIVMIAGLIRPSVIKAASRKQATLIWGGLSLLWFLSFAVYTAPKEADKAEGFVRVHASDYTMNNMDAASITFGPTQSSYMDITIVKQEIFDGNKLVHPSKNLSIDWTDNTDNIRRFYTLSTVITTKAEIVIHKKDNVLSIDYKAFLFNVNDHDDHVVKTGTVVVEGDNYQQLCLPE